MFDYSALRKVPGESQWFCESNNGIELYVAGDDERPDAASLEQAAAVAQDWDQIQKKAVALADGFMKDFGGWHVTGVDLFAAKRDGFDFALTLWFDSADGADAYGNTRFSVYFRAHANQQGPTQNHPSKLVVEFV